jgi:hypothetical protein
MAEFLRTVVGVLLEKLQHDASRMAGVLDGSREVLAADSKYGATRLVPISGGLVSGGHATVPLAVQYCLRTGTAICIKAT